MNQPSSVFSFLLAAGTIAVLFAANCESRGREARLERELQYEREVQLELLTHRAPAPTSPAPIIYVDCPSAEIEPYTDEPFTPISIDEILDQARERRRKLASAGLKPSAARAPGSEPGSQPSSPSAD